MSDEYGAAQPLIDYASKGVNSIKKALSYIPDLPYKGQPKYEQSYYDDMVKKANQSKIDEVKRDSEKKTVRKVARKR